MRATRLPMAKKRLRLNQDILQFEWTLEADGDAKSEGAGRLLGAEPFAVRVRPVWIKQGVGLNFVEDRIDDLFIGLRRHGTEADSAKSDGHRGHLVWSGLFLAGWRARGLDGCSLLRRSFGRARRADQAVAFAEG